MSYKKCMTRVRSRAWGHHGMNYEKFTTRELKLKRGVGSMYVYGVVWCRRCLKTCVVKF